MEDFLQASAAEGPTPTHLGTRASSSVQTRHCGRATSDQSGKVGDRGAHAGSCTAVPQLAAVIGDLASVADCVRAKVRFCIAGSG